MALVGCGSRSDETFNFTIEGDTVRDFSDGVIVYNDSENNRRQIVVQETSPGSNDTRTLTIILPEQPLIGTYELASESPVTAVTAIYVERVGGETRQFTGDVIGDVMITQPGDVISGEIEYVAFDVLGSGEPITVTGSFTELDYTGDNPIDTGPSRFTITSLLLVFVGLLVANVALIYFIGQAVYHDKKDPIKQSLRLDLLLIRGWRVEGYQLYMWGWLVVLLALAGFLIIFLVLLIL